jgi:murein DD-endopeptidase MepM/ murein hydrolase activator NlpD
MGFMEQGSVPPGGKSPSGYSQGSGGGGGGGGSGKSMGYVGAALGAVGAHLWNDTDIDDYLQNDTARRRIGFYSGMGGDQGNQRGADTMIDMMRKGTATSPMDAANAAMAGSSVGLMQGYNKNINANAVTFSNLAPGAGLTGGMQATGALNQAGNVNRLRMIGINVRDDKTGLMRSFTDIADQLWNFLKKNKKDGGAITTEELGLALQSGNSLDSMLNQYFGNDPVLREGVITALYQKAQGGNFKRQSLRDTGASTSAIQAVGERNQMIYETKNLNTDWGLSGMIGGIATNNAISKLEQVMNFLLGPLVTIAAYTKTVAGGKGGGEGIGGGVSDIPMGGGEIGGQGGESSGTIAPINNYSKHITSGYGSRKSPTTGKPSFHKGMDIGVPRGTAIRAAKDGKVVHIGANMDKNSGFGHNVTVQHGDGYQTLYAHMMEAPMVSKGQVVSAGTQLGRVGTTGASTGNHLHFQLQANGKTYDPRPWLAGASSVTGSSGSLSSSTADEATEQSNNLFGASSASYSLFGDPWQSKSNGGTGDGVANYGMGDGGSSGSSGGTSLTRVGGTTVNIHVNGGNFNEEKLAREVKRVLDDQEQVRMAVIR